MYQHYRISDLPDIQIFLNFNACYSQQNGLFFRYR